VALSYADDKLVQGTELLELYREAGWSLLEGRDPERIEAAVRRSGRFFTARDGSKLVGYLLALTDLSLYAHVSELMVRDAYHMKGVTRELLSRFLDSVPDVERVTLFGDPQSEPLYRELGFAPFPGGFMLRR
jgi:hypothetical protein